MSILLLSIPYAVIVHIVAVLMAAINCDIYRWWLGSAGCRPHGSGAVLSRPHPVHCALQRGRITPYPTFSPPSASPFTGSPTYE